MRLNRIVVGLALLALPLSAFADREDVLHTTPVTDQKDTLQCWAVASTSRFDIDASKTAGHLLKLSPRFTFYAKTRSEVIERLLRKDFKQYQGSICEGCAAETIYYEQGGVYADAVEAAKRFGVMPESVYPGFPKGDTTLFRDLNRLIDHYMRQPGSPDRAEVVSRVTALLDHHVGAPPARFEYEGRPYDPRSFFEAVLPGWDQAQALELNYAPDARDEKTTTDAFDGVKYPALSTGNHARLMDVLERAMRLHQAALIQYKVIDEDHTQHNGHIGFAVQGLKAPSHVDWNSPEILDHYVMAIGARYSDDGELRAIYVKNTWGTSRADNFGFHWLEADYFPLIEAVEIDGVSY